MAGPCLRRIAQANLDIAHAQVHLDSVAAMLGLWTGAAGGNSSDIERLVLFQLPSMLPAPPPVRAPPSAAIKAEPGGSGGLLAVSLLCLNKVVIVHHQVPTVKTMLELELLDGSSSVTSSAVLLHSKMRFIDETY